MKKILILVFAALSWSTVNAQLQNGSIAPDFILKDLNGNTWHLYELLDQGKSVVLDFSATWCNPCWNYHQSGALEDLYTEYGPNGTGEVMVFMIEGDDNTNIDCLYNLPGCNSSTQGNWVDGTPYPIINDDTLATLYGINYWPTIYHICSNRLLTESNQEPTAAVYALHGECIGAFGANNAAVLEYNGFSGFFCGVKTFTPSIKVQNLGTADLTSASAEIWLNGNLQQTVNWTGNLATYGIENIAFDELTLSANTDIEIKITNVNNTADEDPANNLIAKSALLAVETSQNYLTLELRTDTYPKETYWEMRNADGALFYSGGNASVLSGSNVSGAYDQPNSVYNIELPMPGDGCYEFAIYDAYGDGICCAEGPGYFKLKDPNGNVIVEGGEFTIEDHKPFSISNAANPILNNGAITGYGGESGSFCGTLNYHPAISIMNLGNTPITSAVVEVSSGGTVIGSTTFNGFIGTAQTVTFSLNTIALDASVVLDISIKSINGVSDDFDFNNSYQVALTKNYTEEHEMTMFLQVDNFGYELYWQLQNSAGDVLYSGGNELVGASGGGQRVASPGDPGAYAALGFVTEDFVLPGNVNDCYEFVLMDDFGDGMVDGGGGFLQIIDFNAVDILLEDYTTTQFTVTNNRIEVHPVTSGLNALELMSNFQLFPNPSSGEVNVAFSLSAPMPLQISVYNLLGELVVEMQEKDFAQGANSLKLDMSKSSNSVYYLKMSNGNQQMTRKFTVLRG